MNQWRKFKRDCSAYCQYCLFPFLWLYKETLSLPSVVSLTFDFFRLCFHKRTWKYLNIIWSWLILWNSETPFKSPLCVLVPHSCPTLCNSMDCSPQVPLSMEFSSQDYCRRLPFPISGDLPDPQIEPMSLVSPAGRFFTTAPPGKPQICPYAFFKLKR